MNRYWIMFVLILCLFIIFLFAPWEIETNQTTKQPVTASSLTD